MVISRDWIVLGGLSTGVSMLFGWCSDSFRMVVIWFLDGVVMVLDGLLDVFREFFESWLDGLWFMFDGV